MPSHVDTRGATPDDERMGGTGLTFLWLAAQARLGPAIGRFDLAWRCVSK